MTNKEKAEKIEDVLKGQDLFKVLSVDDVNHKPHPYMIGPRHITYASDHHSGRLGEEILKAVQCAHVDCRLSYEEHTSDNVCFLQLLRNGTNEEAQTVLKALVDTIDNLVDGFAFVETPEKYRML